MSYCVIQCSGRTRLFALWKVKKCCPSTNRLPMHNRRHPNPWPFQHKTQMDLRYVLPFRDLSSFRCIQAIRIWTTNIWLHNIVHWCSWEPPPLIYQMSWPLQTVLTSATNWAILKRRYQPINIVFTTSHIACMIRKQKKCLARHFVRLLHQTQQRHIFMRTLLHTSAKRPSGNAFDWYSRTFLSMCDVWSVLAEQIDELATSSTRAMV